MIASRAGSTEPLVGRLKARFRAENGEEAIEKFVSGILAEAGQESLPIRVAAVASFLGISCRSGSFPFAGRIYSEPSGQLVMDLNSDDNKARQRFTCGHEIVHTAFPGFTREARYRVDVSVGHNLPGRSEEEYLCDFGASLLLMPAELIKDRYRLEKGLKTIEQLANDAQVSLEAAGNRLVGISGRPAAFLVLEVGHKPADARAIRQGLKVEPKLRVRYGTLTGIRGYVPRFKSVPENSAYQQALLKRSIVSAAGTLPGADRPSFRIEAGWYPRSEGDREIPRVLAVALPLQ